MSDELVQRLRDATTDFNDMQMVDNEPPRDLLTCKHIRACADEIERLRAEVADLGRRYADSESNLAACGYALKTVRSALAALRKRVAACRCTPSCEES